MMTLDPRTKLGRYEILSKLGAGGMGEVYLAQDTKLDRKVALKILPAELASRRDRMERFVREAKSAAALNHPNIATIHEIGESEGVNFIAMEFIDGNTFREEIHQKRTALPKLLKYLHQIAEGLAKAHAAGIVHRDLKPDNLMISGDGHAKILDFGLAKLIEQQPMPTGNASEVATAMMPQQSSPGALMGTVGYMSPEQAKAKPVDQRSDIFSFGCVLYEAATGRRPFVGDSTVETLHKIISDPAPAITESNPEAPAELQRIIRKCLAKEPEKRYQLIRETANDLEEVIEELKGPGNVERSVVPAAATSTVAVGSPQSTQSVSQPASSAEYVLSGIKSHKLAVAAVVVVLLALIGGGYWYWRSSSAGSNLISSIAVMPFVNESGNQDVEYLSDGMTETLIRSLSQAANLHVKPRSSVFRYKEKDTDANTIGTELNVQAILNGRVVQRGEQLIVSLELIDVQKDVVIWTEQYSRKMGDLASLQSEIARDVISRLTKKLPGADLAKLNKQHTADPAAFQLYLRGRYEAGKFTEDGYNKCIEHLNQAIARDPNFALAYDGLSFCYYANWYLPAKMLAEKGRAAATRALELDPNLPEAHASLATIAAWFDYDWETAEKGFRRAIELAPELGLAHSYNGVMLASLGRFDQAIAETEKAVELEPFSAEINAMLGLVYFYSGNNEKAEGQFRKTIEIDPNFWYAHTHLARTIEKLGNREAAVSMLEKAKSMQGATAEPLMHLARIYAAIGRRGDVEKIIDELKRPKWTNQMDGYEFAVIYAALGDKDTAFAYLDTEHARGSWWLNFAKVDPDLDPLRSDPRFSELLRKLNFTN